MVWHGIKKEDFDLAIVTVAVNRNPFFRYSKK